MDEKKKKKMIDLSAFLLFEAAGDSEGDDFDYKMMYLAGISTNAMVLDIVEEDAQSTSYEYDNNHHDSDDYINSGSGSSSNNNNVVSDYLASKKQVISIRGSCIIGSDHHYSTKDEEEEEVRIHCKRIKMEDDEIRKLEVVETSEVRSTASSSRCRNRKSCIDSGEGNNKLSDIDQNKLFWEACLTS